MSALIEKYRYAVVRDGYADAEKLYHQLTAGEELGDASDEAFAELAEAQAEEYNSAVCSDCRNHQEDPGALRKGLCRRCRNRPGDEERAEMLSEIESNNGLIAELQDKNRRLRDRLNR